MIGTLDDNLRVMRVDPLGAVEVAHITNPDDWLEIPFEAMLLDVAFVPSQGIVLRQSRSSQPLVRACLAFEDLKRLAAHLQLPFGSCSRKELFKKLIKQFLMVMRLGRIM